MVELAVVQRPGASGSRRRRGALPSNRRRGPSRRLGVHRAGRPPARRAKDADGPENMTNDKTQRRSADE